LEDDTNTAPEHWFEHRDYHDADYHDIAIIPYPQVHPVDIGGNCGSKHTGGRPRQQTDHDQEQRNQQSLGRS
jgi:hypothetical protein